jgi:tetratricopeptide (TPR) repeat protein
VAQSPDSFEANRSISEHYFAVGDMDAGYPYLQKALALDPSYAAGHNQMGIYHFQHGRLDEAERSFSQALQADFDLLDAHFNLASVYHEKGDYSRALAFYKEVVQARPDDAEVLTRMAHCLLAIDSLDDAAVLFREALTHQPGMLEPAIGLSNLLLRRGQTEQATEVLLSFAEHNADAPPLVHYTLGLLFEGQGQYRTAMTHFRDVVVADEQSEEAFFHLGRCARLVGRGEDAVAFLSRAVKIEPAYTEAIFELGQVYFDLAQWENAIVAFRECLRVQADRREQAAQWGDAVDEAEDVPVYNALGYCHLKMEDYDTARSAWEKSLSLNPDQPEVEQAIADIPRPLHKPVSLTIDD